MLGKDLSMALGDVSDSRIEAAAHAYERIEKRRTLLFRIAAMAATIAVLIAVALWPGVNQDGEFITAPGVLKVYASSAEEIDYEMLEENQLLQDNRLYACWFPFMSGLQGMQFHPKLEEGILIDSNITFEMTTNYGELFIRDTDIRGKKVTIPENQTIYWEGYEIVFGHSESTSLEEYLEKIGKIYVDIVVKADNQFVGYAVFEIEQYERNSSGFIAKQLTTVFFPKVDGEFQSVTEEYIYQRIADLKVSNMSTGGEDMIN